MMYSQRQRRDEDTYQSGNKSGWLRACGVVGHKEQSFANCGTLVTLNTHDTPDVRVILLNHATVLSRILQSQCECSGITRVE